MNIGAANPAPATLCAFPELISPPEPVCPCPELSKTQQTKSIATTCSQVRRTNVCFISSTPREINLECVQNYGQRFALAASTIIRMVIGSRCRPRIGQHFRGQIQIPTNKIPHHHLGIPGIKLPRAITAAKITKQAKINTGCRPASGPKRLPQFPQSDQHSAETSLSNDLNNATASSPSNPKSS